MVKRDRNEMGFSRRLKWGFSSVRGKIPKLMYFVQSRIVSSAWEDAYSMTDKKIIEKGVRNEQGQLLCIYHDQSRQNRALHGCHQ